DLCRHRSQDSASRSVEHAHVFFCVQVNEFGPQNLLGYIFEVCDTSNCERLITIGFKSRNDLEHLSLGWMLFKEPPRCQRSHLTPTAKPKLNAGLPPHCAKCCPHQPHSTATGK